MANILKGAEAAASLNIKTKAVIEELKVKGIYPTLGILRVGERQDDISYENSIIKCCSSLGIAIKKYQLDQEITQSRLQDTIHEMNNDESIHGILMFRPLPKHLDENAACLALLPKKDIDGITDSSLTGVFTGKKQGYPPCTAQACIEILDHYRVECTGKKAVIVGRSLVVGKPLAMMLLDKNATVTICHSKTEDLPSVSREADILITAIGHAGAITGSFLSSGQIVIDVGINVNQQGKLCGDVDFYEAASIVEAITPVPGGVGSVTTAVLAFHVAEAAERQL